MPSPRTRKPKPILSGKRDHPRTERIGSHTLFGRSPIQFRAAKRIIAGDIRRTPSISPPRRSICAKRWRSLIVVTQPAQGISQTGGRMTGSAKSSRGKGEKGGGLEKKKGQKN